MRRGVRVPQLEAVCPLLLDYVWEWYKAIRRRQVGRGPISATEFKAWSDLRGIAFTPREIETLELIDDAFLDVFKGVK